ncbi:MAG TPA: FecR domain-containing protein [Opitutaceae bacterium]|nr:FecR domain-containing protein [Opitutaceae bacterium]
MKLRSPFMCFCWFTLLCGVAFVARAQSAAPAAPAAAASSPQAHGSIKVARVTGEVFAVDKSSGLRSRVSQNSLVADNQVVETGHNASVVLVFSNGAVVNVKADSQLEISEFLQNPFADSFRVREATHEPSVSTTKLYLRKGEIISQVKKLNRDAGSSFTVETAVGAAGIRGTAFRISYLIGSNGVARYALSMAEGLIRFTPLRGRSVEVPAGREISLAAQINLTTSAVMSVGETSPAIEVSPAGMAELQQEVTDTVGAALNVQFVPSATTGQTPSSNSTATTTDSSSPNTAEPGSDTGDTSGPLASPPPVPPAQRTTPGDGE